MTRISGRSRWPNFKSELKFEVTALTLQQRAARIRLCHYLIKRAGVELASEVEVRVDRVELDGCSPVTVENNNFMIRGSWSMCFFKLKLGKGHWVGHVTDGDGRSRRFFF